MFGKEKNIIYTRKMTRYFMNLKGQNLGQLNTSKDLKFTIP